MSQGGGITEVTPLSHALPSLCVQVSLSLSSCSLPEHLPQIIINIVNKSESKLLNVKYAEFLPELSGQFINVTA